MDVKIKKSFANKSLKLPIKVQKVIKQEIINLKATSDLSAIKCTKLKGYSDRYRIRIGNYRMIFKVESKSQIFLTAIAQRKEIYNKLFELIF